MLAVISVAAGVSLGVSVLILTSSVSSSLRSFGDRLAGPAEFRVVGATARGGLEQSVLPAVLATPGVAAAVPVVEAVTLADGGRASSLTVLALGVDCHAQVLVGVVGCSNEQLAAVDARGLVFASSSLIRRLGANPSLSTDIGRVPLVAAPANPMLDSLNGGDVAVVGLPLAQRIFDRPQRLDAIYVVPAKGTDLRALSERLQYAVGNWNGVLRANAAPPGVSELSRSFVPIFTVLGLFALGVGAVLVFNILTLNVEERRTELAIVAAIGATPSTVVAGAVSEGLLIGLAGGLLGCVGGFVLAHPLTDSLSKFTRPYVGAPVTVHVTQGTVILGCVIGAAIGSLAAALAARRAMRMDVAAELSLRELRTEASPRPNLARAVVFLSVSGAGLGICWVAQRDGALQPWQASLAPIGVLVSIVGFLLAGASLAVVVAELGARLLGGRRGVLSLGTANLARDPRRTGVMTVAVGAAVATAFVIGSTHQAARAAIVHGFTTGHPQELAVSTIGVNNTFNLDAKPSPDLVSALSRIPGVAGVDRGVFELSGHDANHLVGVSAFDDPWLNAPLILGSKSRDGFANGRVLIGPGLARSRNLRPGSRLELDTPSGLSTVVVGGIWEDGNVNGYAVTTPMWLFRQLYGDQPPESIGLIPAPGVTTMELAARVTAAHLGPDIKVDTPAQLANEVSKGVGQQLTAFVSIQRSLTVVAFVAVLSTMLLVGVQRRRELGLLAAIGMEPSQLARMTLSEGAGAGLIGTVLSVGGAVIATIGFYWILPILIGYKDPLLFDFGSLLTWTPIVIVLVTLASLLPAWRNAHLQVVEALHYE
ncbi:MAG TPA: FtsX-like permease family protein [Acidimicrobiales bacterium]|nr:FtsX-like permease family protein [Acidimicrobiales bacterium]